jgi:hypothetical protein
MTEAFEEIVATLLESEGCFVRSNVFLKLPLDIIAEAGLHRNSPSFQIDLIAWHPSNPSRFFVIECKYTDNSDALDYGTFAGYRLFNDPSFRAAIEGELRQQRIVSNGAHITYCLASSSTQAAHRAAIKSALGHQGMLLLDRAWRARRLLRLGRRPGYGNCLVRALASHYHHPSAHSGRYR